MAGILLRAVPAGRRAWQGVWLALALCVTAPAVALEPAPSGRITATGSMEVLFSPWQDVEARINRAIADARHDIYVQAFLFTSRPIAAALIEAHRRGVKVEVLADFEMNGKGDRSSIPVLAAAGIPVALETRYASAHNKVILVDPDDAEGVVITGSYNFTYSARARNAENLLLLRGNPAPAQRYLENWRRHRRDAVAWADRDSQPTGNTAGRKE